MAIDEQSITEAVSRLRLANHGVDGNLGDQRTERFDGHEQGPRSQDKTVGSIQVGDPNGSRDRPMVPVRAVGGDRVAAHRSSVKNTGGAIQMKDAVFWLTALLTASVLTAALTLKIVDALH
jgi:hypothetical protein